MSTHYNPKIVTSGLIMALDAINTKSYPGSGSTWTDLTGNSNTATLVNSPTYSNGYFTFDGSTQYATVAGTPVAQTAYTKMIWLYVTNFATNNNLLSSDVGGNIFWLGGNSGTKLVGAHTDTSFTLVQGATNLSLNTWYCGAVTFSTVSGWVIYLNGLSDATNATVSQRPGTGAVQVGAYANGNLFSGRLACPMIYNRALTAAEIKQNFNALRGRFGV